ncbi:MAG: signal peptidase I [Ruminococcus sp.]|nr:signal peptidase I [Ruminococcus sp.]
MKKVLSIVLNVFAWIVLIFALLITVVVFSSGKNNGVANLFGYIPMTVESDSMKPTFSKNDLIICKEVDDVQSLKEGDVITFWTMINGQRAKNTHRIVTVNDDGSFITRGDNNPAEDTDAVRAADVIGKWTNTKIEGFGKVMNFLRTKKGFFICILIPMAIFFLIELYKFIVALIEAKRPEPAEQLDEEEIKRRAIEEYLASKGESAENAAAKASEAVSSAAEKAEDTAEKAAENFEEAKKEAFEKFEAVKQEAEKLEKKAADDAKNIAENAAETAVAAAEKAGEAAE